MNRIWSIIALIGILLIFICYIAYDLAFKKDIADFQNSKTEYESHWEVSKIFDVSKGKLKAVAVSDDDKIFIAGDSFISSYSADFSLNWEYDTDYPITAIATKNDMIFAASEHKIIIFDKDGNKIAEWGPFDANSILTSISVNDTYIAVADAGVKAVYILNYNGNIQHVIGKADNNFIVPSPFFDVSLEDNNTIFIANPGRFRVERRNIDGTLIDYFGEAGLEPSEFCGCCNPAHIYFNNGRIFTAEKGINRIKILDNEGEFIEFVSINNNFLAPIPLDIAVSADGSTVYGAYSGNSKLYIFKRKLNAAS
jgi:DNA-binding beta-propeller fold protein YncE